MTNHTTARQRLLRFPLILGVTTALIFSACSTGTNNNSAPSDKGTVTSQSPRQVENATNVLQNVNIQMGRDGEVSSIESTNIYVNDKDRTSSSSNVQFELHIARGARTILVIDVNVGRLNRRNLAVTTHLNIHVLQNISSVLYLAGTLRSNSTLIGRGTVIVRARGAGRENKCRRDTQNQREAE